MRTVAVCMQRKFADSAPEEYSSFCWPRREISWVRGMMLVGEMTWLARLLRRTRSRSSLPPKLRSLQQRYQLQRRHYPLFILTSPYGRHPITSFSAKRVLKLSPCTVLNSGFRNSLDVDPSAPTPHRHPATTTRFYGKLKIFRNMYSFSTSEENTEHVKRQSETSSRGWDLDHDPLEILLLRLDEFERLHARN